MRTASLYKSFSTTSLWEGEFDAYARQCNNPKSQLTAASSSANDLICRATCGYRMTHLHMRCSSHQSNFRCAFLHYPSTGACPHALCPPQKLPLICTPVTFGHFPEQERYAGLTEKIEELMVDPEFHLNAAVYTAVSDVEAEINGWVTYDRQVR